MPASNISNRQRAFVFPQKIDFFRVFFEYSRNSCYICGRKQNTTFKNLAM